MRAFLVGHVGFSHENALVCLGPIGWNWRQLALNIYVNLFPLTHVNIPLVLPSLACWLFDLTLGSLLQRLIILFLYVCPFGFWPLYFQQFYYTPCHQNE